MIMNYVQVKEFSAVVKQGTYTHEAFLLRIGQRPTGIFGTPATCKAKTTQEEINLHAQSLKLIGNFHQLKNSY